MVDDRLAEGLALLGVRRQRGQVPTGATPVAQAAIPSRPESSACNAIARPPPSGPIRRSRSSSRPSKLIAAVVEAGQAHFALRRLSFDAGAVTRRKEAGNAVCAVLAGAGEERVEVGLATVGDPGLGAVDAVGAGALVELRAAAHRGRITAGLGLRTAIRSEQLAASMPGSQRCFCPSVPKLCSAQQDITCTLTPTATVAQGRMRSPRAPAGRSRTGARRRRTPQRTASKQSELTELGEYLARETVSFLIGRRVRRQLPRSEVPRQLDDRFGLRRWQQALRGHLRVS